MFILPHLKPPNVFDILGPDRFRCSCCFKVNRKAWSDEEALAEHYAREGADAEVSTELLCDDCYDVALLIIKLAGQDNRRRQPA